MIVIKLGGHAMSMEGGQEKARWCSELAMQWRAGKRFVVVHGGGPMIESELTFRKIESHFIDGLRVTTSEIAEVVETVLTGTVLRSIVSTLRLAGLPAVGISGNDGGLLEVERVNDERLGFVGNVRHVNPEIIHALLDANFLPVISPTSRDGQGQTLNINGDIAAGAIAGAVKADEMIFMTDVPGIYANWPDRSSLISEISANELSEMTFASGMIPKVSAAVNSITSGARSARIIDGKSEEGLSEALAGRGGTWVKR